MRKYLITVAAVLLSTSMAFAGGLVENNHYNDHSTTNNYSTTNNNPTANAAAGAFAGAAANAAGGSAYNNTNVGVGVNTANVNRNDVNVRNSNTQGQGQDQNQAQNQGQRQGQGQVQGNIGLGSGNSTKVTVGGDNYEAPAIAPNLGALTVSNGTCMGSSNGGIGVKGFSFGAGTTWRDKECEKRFAFQLALAAGMSTAARTLFLDLDAVKEAVSNLAANEATVAAGFELSKAAAEKLAKAAEAGEVPVPVKPEVDRGPISSIPGY